MAIVGRPNVGKSTLLNTLVGEKLSIVTDKPHTTRQRVLGVLNRGPDQAVFIDTPGHARRTKRALHRLMARQIHQALEDCDVALLVVEAERLTSQDYKLIEILGDKIDRAFLVVNKIDALASKIELLPTLEKLATRPFAAMLPVSARTGENLERLVEQIFERLPVGPKQFPDGMVTDRDLAFRVAETIREKLMTLVHKEVPYGLTVEVEHLGMNEEGQRLIHALIWLERESQKKYRHRQGRQRVEGSRHAGAPRVARADRRARASRALGQGPRALGRQRARAPAARLRGVMSEREQVLLERGFVLHQRPYRDSSQLLECMTATHGRIGLVARGSRRAATRQRALLQPFVPLKLSWVRRGELGRLTHVEDDGPSYALEGQRLLAGFYANELLLRLTARGDPNGEAFFLL